MSRWMILKLLTLNMFLQLFFWWTASLELKFKKNLFSILKAFKNFSTQVFSTFEQFCIKLWHSSKIICTQTFYHTQVDQHKLWQPKINLDWFDLRKNRLPVKFHYLPAVSLFFCRIVSSGPIFSSSKQLSVQFHQRSDENFGPTFENINFSYIFLQTWSSTVASGQFLIFPK